MSARSLFLSSILTMGLLSGAACAQQDAAEDAKEPGSNPLFTDRFTADPAPIVHDGKIWLYVGHDEASGEQMFNITEWLVYSSEDARTWTDHGPVMQPTDFDWAIRDAWASEVIEKDDKFWFYTTVEHDETHPGKSIGVAVADSPTGPFVDARGSALVTNDMTDGPHSWDDIDPTVFIDDDGTPWLFWGNNVAYYARLKDNMIELDSAIMTINLTHFEEGPWLHKRGDWYYLTYAGIDEEISSNEQIHYSMSRSIEGPWEYKGMLTGPGENSFTIHPGIVEFKDQWYFFYHDASLSIGDEDGDIGRRAVRVEYLYYNEDGTIQPLEQTAEGVSGPPSR